MQLIARHLQDVLEIRTNRFSDDRGWFQVVFNRDDARALGIDREFIQDNHVCSLRPGTIRGLHLQVPPHAQGKLVRVARGKVKDVVVDVRPGSATFGQHVAVELSTENGHLLWIPGGYAHGYCTLEPNTEVLYKVDSPWVPSAERSIAWNDPDLAIDWPVAPSEASLSPKDAEAQPLSAILPELERLTR